MNISSEAIIYNRYIDEQISLPYSFNDIKIQANDTVSSDLLNLKLKHLYDNFIYLYRSSLIASNVIPISCTAIAGITANSIAFTWYRNLSTSQFVSISSNPLDIGLDNTNLTFLIQNKDTLNYTAFLASNNYFKAFQFDTNATYFNNTYTHTETNPGQGTSLKNITAFALWNDYLFLLDSGLNQIIKYDASGFTSNNTITRDKLVYIDSIGNKGNSKLEFNSPTGITICNNDIYVLDSGNKAVKQYDINLNWKYTFRLPIDFLNSYPLDIGSDINNNFYILTNDSKLFIYNYTFSSKQIINLQKIKENGESFFKIVFSKENTNIFYLISNKNIYKKLITSPDSTVGKYLLYLFKYNLTEEQITSFSSAYSPTGDKNILFSFFNNTGKLGYFFDNINLFDILAVRDFDIYTFNEISFNKNEFLQNWVFNKNISKMLINHMRFRDQIIGKFIASQDINNNVVFKGTRYLLPDELNSIFFQQDISFFIGANEIVTNNIVNRSLRKLFNIQNSMLNILKSEILDVLTLNKPVVLN